MARSRSLGPGMVLGALAIVLLPWVVGLALFGLRDTSGPPIASAATDTRKQINSHLTYQEVQVDWTFCPDWQFKPLLAGPAEYLVFMFHYANTGAYPISLMPTCTFVSPGEPRQAVNEEIAMYIEDAIEDQVHAEDQVPISFRIPAGEQRHYIAVFERPPGLKLFYVEVDAWQGRCLRIHYRRTGGGEKPVWVNDHNEWVEKYLGRG
jgi:hypothetical protein